MVSLHGMKVLTARVVGGSVEVGDEVADGTPVAVFAPGQGAELTASEEEEISLAIDEIERGEYEDGFALLREIQDRVRR